jgi:hypothetical protein
MIHGIAVIFVKIGIFLELAVVVTDTAGVVICGVVLDTPVAISLVDETISVFDK